MSAVLREHVLRAYHHFLDCLQASEEGAVERVDVWRDCSLHLRESHAQMLLSLDVLAENAERNGQTQMEETIVRHYEMVDALQTHVHLLELCFMTPNTSSVLGLCGWLAAPLDATLRLRLQQCMDTTRPEISQRSVNSPHGLDYWRDVGLMAVVGRLDLVAQMLQLHSEVAIALRSPHTGGHNMGMSALLALIPLLAQHPTVGQAGWTQSDAMAWRRKLQVLLSPLDDIILQMPGLGDLVSILQGQASTIQQYCGGSWRAFACGQIIHSHPTITNRASAAAIIESSAQLAGGVSRGDEGLLACVRECLSGGITASLKTLWDLSAAETDASIRAVCVQTLAHMCVVLFKGADRKEVIMPLKGSGFDGSILEHVLVQMAEVVQRLELPPEMIVTYLSLCPAGCARGVDTMARLLPLHPVHCDQDVLSLCALLRVQGLHEAADQLYHSRGDYWLRYSVLADVVALMGDGFTAEPSQREAAPASKALYFYQLARRGDRIHSVLDAALCHSMLSLKAFINALQIFPGPPLPGARGPLDIGLNLNAAEGFFAQAPRVRDDAEKRAAVAQAAVRLCSDLLQTLDLSCLPKEAAEALCLPELQADLLDYSKLMDAIIVNGPSKHSAFLEAAAHLSSLLHADPMPRVSIRYRLHLVELSVWLHGRCAEQAIAQSPSRLYLQRRPVQAMPSLLAFSKAQAQDLLVSLTELQMLGDASYLYKLCQTSQERVKELEGALLGMIAVADLAESKLADKGRELNTEMQLEPEPETLLEDDLLMGAPMPRKALRGFSGSYAY